MDQLINSNKDVDLLSDKGIIDNRLGDSNAVTYLINNLNSEFYDLCNDLNKFYEVPWYRWKATLNKYFNTSWGTTSTIASILLLVLTLIQTSCSVIQVV